MIFTYVILQIKNYKLALKISRIIIIELNYYHFKKILIPMKKLFISLLISAAFILQGCEKAPEPKDTRIITSSWIGYSPLFYAKEAGWLDELNVSLTTMVSLGEAKRAFQEGNFEAITGTQFEYQRIEQEGQLITPVMLLDRSNGGDMIMSNVDVATLQKTKEKIDVYLEMNSVNSLVLQDFIVNNGLTSLELNLVHNNQLTTTKLMQRTPPTKPVIVATYSPYDFYFEKAGLKTIESTRDHKSLLVIDALYADNRHYQDNPKLYDGLRNIIHRSLDALEKNPEDFYQKVFPYLEDISYETFVEGLGNIEWANKPSDDLLNELEKRSFDTSEVRR